MTYIVHVLSRADWEAFREQEKYRPRSLDEQGFVHIRSSLGSEPGDGATEIADTT